MNIFIESFPCRFLRFNLWMNLEWFQLEVLDRFDGTTMVWMIQFDLLCWFVDTHFCWIRRINGCWGWRINEINLFKALPFFSFMSKKQFVQWSGSGQRLFLLSLLLIVVFRCVISTMCDPQMQFQRINPSTQVALFSRCTDNCSDLTSITWKIYRGSINSSVDNLTQWIPFNPTDQSFFGKSLLLVLALRHRLSLSKERRRAISQRPTICSRRMLMFIAEDSKLFILFLAWWVPVRWISKSILRQRMDLVQFNLRVEQHQRHSLFLVSIGSIKMKSKIILSTLCSMIPLGLHNARWSVSRRIRTFEFIFPLVINRWLLSFEIKEIVSLNGRISPQLLFNRIRKSSKISCRSSTDNRHRIHSFNFSQMGIRIKLDKWSHLSLNTSINSTTTTFNKSFRSLRSILQSSRAIRIRLGWNSSTNWIVKLRFVNFSFNCNWNIRSPRWKQWNFKRLLFDNWLNRQINWLDTSSYDFFVFFSSWLIRYVLFRVTSLDGVWLGVKFFIRSEKTLREKICN